MHSWVSLNLSECQDCTKKKELVYRFSSSFKRYATTHCKRPVPRGMTIQHIWDKFGYLGTRFTTRHKNGNNVNQGQLFLWLSLGLVNQIRSIFQNHFGSSWVEAMEVFTDMTKLVEAFGLVYSILWCYQQFLCYMTCHNQLELWLWMIYPHTERSTIYRRP